VGGVAHAGDPLDRDDEVRDCVGVPLAARQESSDAHAGVVAVVLGPVAGEQCACGYLCNGDLELGVLPATRRSVFIPVDQLAGRVARARHHGLAALAAAAEAQLDDGLLLVVHQLYHRLLARIVGADVEPVRSTLAGAAVDGVGLGEKVRRELDGFDAIEVYVAVAV
jgi:hypothetical protein